MGLTIVFDAVIVTCLAAPPIASIGGGCSKGREIFCFLGDGSTRVGQLPLLGKVLVDFVWDCDEVIVLVVQSSLELFIS